MLKIPSHFRRAASMRPIHFIISGLWLGLGLSFGSPAEAAELTPQQKSVLTQAQSELGRVQTNLKLAQDSAGSGVPKGSKAKLAAVRLGSAKQGVPKLQNLMKQLPAGEAQVKSVQQQVDAVIGAINQLEARLTGKASGGQSGGQKAGGSNSGGNSKQPPQQAKGTTQGSTATKLDYRQEKKLKDARYYIRELVGMDGALKNLVAQVKPIQDLKTIDHRVIQQGMNTIAKARERAGYVRNSLQDLPAKGQGVAPVTEEFKSSMASIEACEKALAPIHKKLSALINMANYPEYAADSKRLKELSLMYNNVNMMPDQVERISSLITSLDPATAEHKKLVDRYSILAYQQVDQGRAFMSIANGFARNIQEFQAALQQQKTSLPNGIRTDLKEASELISEAVEKQKPLYFAGGISSVIERAEQKVALYRAIDAQAADSVQGELEEVREHMKRSQASLKDVIIAANTLPPDRYQGGDREAISQLAINAWKEKESGAKILGVRIPNQEWKHEVLWRNQTGTWYKIDRSRIQIQLVVRFDEKTAVIRPINLWKDHLSNDQIKAYRFHSEEHELQPSEFLLLDKVK